MHLLVILVAVAVCMVAQDLLSTLLVNAEIDSRHAWRAGMLDAAGDVVSRIGTAYSAGVLILHGWTLVAILALAVTAATSLFATRFATRLADRWKTETPVERDVRALQADVAALEAELAHLTRS